jgi:hypothetical protein
MATRTKLTQRQRGEYVTLKRELDQAQAAINRSPRPTDKQVATEEAAYTSLCDWAEENDLNYTEYDIRGTREEHEATQ